MLISDEYRQINRDLHRIYPTYGIGGHRWANTIKRAGNNFKCRSILDYGCGKGSLLLALAQSFSIKGYDPAVEWYEERPEVADMIVSTNMLEHVEPECLEDVLRDMRELGRKAIFATVATKSAGRLLPDGRDSHLILGPRQWWVERIGKFWELSEISLDNRRDESFYFIGIPK